MSGRTRRLTLSRITGVAADHQSLGVQVCARRERRQRVADQLDVALARLLWIERSQGNTCMRYRIDAIQRDPSAAGTRGLREDRLPVYRRRLVPPSWWGLATSGRTAGRRLLAAGVKPERRSSAWTSGAKPLMAARYCALRELRPQVLDLPSEGRRAHRQSAAGGQGMTRPHQAAAMDPRTAPNAWREGRE